MKRLVTVYHLIYIFQMRSESDELWLDDGDYVCNQIIKDVNGHADFVHHCCTHPNQCAENIDNKWIQILYILIAVMKVNASFIL